ncbi:MAG: MFS transporter [Rubrobacteraceae bacterium]
MREARLVLAGVVMISVTHGVARFAYGLFVPEFREEFGLSGGMLGVIGAGSYVSYCFGIAASAILATSLGPRVVVVVAGFVAVSGMAVIAAAVAPWMLAVGVLGAGVSTGLSQPPLVDAVARTLDPEKQDRAQAVINSGPGFGISLSGPVALLAAGEWRSAWFAFVVIGVIATVWNAFAIPDKERVQAADEPERLSASWLVRPGSAPLFASAFAIGFSVSAYWTFSRDLVVQAGLSPFASTAFWVVIGVSGIVGAAAGDLVARFGLRRVLPLTLLVTAAVTLLLALAPGSPIPVFGSAALFGAAYIVLTALLLLWAVEVFRERPSAGLAAAFLFLAVGQTLGSITSGVLAEQVGLGITFIAFAAAAAATALIRPGSEIKA